MNRMRGKHPGSTEGQRSVAGKGQRTEMKVEVYGRGQGPKKGQRKSHEKERQERFRGQGE